MTKASLKFTTREIDLILKSLPAEINPRRVELLPCVLLKWDFIFSQAYNLSKVPIETIDTRFKQLKAVEVSAKKLLLGLDALENKIRASIIPEMIRAKGLTDGLTERAKMKERFEEERDFLAKLASVAATKRQIWKLGPGQRRNTPAAFVIMDIAAIFEWLTDTAATRQVDRSTKRDTGPFWQFAASIWPVVFGQGDDGLSSAIKNWAHSRNYEFLASPLLLNISMRHPEWGIFQS